MNYRTLLSVSLAAIGFALLMFGTGGFSAMEADRNVHVSVVESENAYLAIEPLDPDGLSPNNSEQEGLFKITNNLGSELEITAVRPVEETHTGPPPKLKRFEQHGEWPTSLGPTESGVISGVPVCKGLNETESRTFKFEITATSTTATISISVTESVTITCDGTPGESGDTPGQNNVTDDSGENGNDETPSQSSDNSHTGGDG